ncbi:DUF2061 domain-containing protein [Mesonia aestuariivivens]|uniref:DUF2061 domain-containing protein n=1 Tax=Mesonia aestuariivivens TaxID=2796128 RepID=A0ABS6W1U6_9FLAO|nr:DUF2061 domain-containing protein [Mesonia aestuariivivens]MBW2961532.1 DUF2061 domain-containing protein [Mesonia aestuariivivens]
MEKKNRKVKIAQKRHIAKAVTWRTLGTLDTVLLGSVIDNSETGAILGTSELISKPILYYFHERIWAKANLNKKKELLNSRKRHITKAVTWRIIGTIDTTLLGWLISGNPYIGLQIGLTEVITKIFLYYLHERLWYKTNFGISYEEEIKPSVKKITNE